VAGDHHEARARELGRELLEAEELEARRQVHEELDNLRSALVWALDRDNPDDVELGVGITAELAAQTACDMASGIGVWSELALPHAERSTPARRWSVRGAASYTATVWDGDPERAAAIARAALVEEIPSDSPALGLVYPGLGMALQYLEEWDELFATLERGEVDLAAIGAHPFWQANHQSTWSNFLATFGDLAQTRLRAARALEIARELQNPSALALALFSVAWGEWEERPEVALAAVQESIALTRAGAVDGAFGGALVTLARVSETLGDRRAWFEALREAIAYSHEVGDFTNLTYALYYAVQVFTAIGEHEVAAEVYGAAVLGRLRAMALSFGGREQERREHALSSMRNALGDDAFDAIAPRGAVADRDHVAALAIGVLDRRLAEVDEADNVD